MFLITAATALASLSVPCFLAFAAFAVRDLMLG